MAKKRKRVNTALVGGLTVVGIVLTVSTVAVFAYMQTQRDPRELAGLAEQFEAAGDVERAAANYYRAHQAALQIAPGDPEEAVWRERATDYVLAASRLQFNLGLWRESIGMLDVAHDEMKDNTRILMTLLERLTKLGDFGQVPWQMVRNNAFALLALAEEEPVFDYEPQALDIPETADALEARLAELAAQGREVPTTDEYVTGLLHYANAIRNQPSDTVEDARAEAAEALATVVRPTDPLLVELKAGRAFTMTASDIAELERFDRGSPEYDQALEALIRRKQAAAAEVLTAGLAANPGHPKLLDLYGNVMVLHPFLQGQQFADVRQPEAVLEKIRAALPAHAGTDAELNLRLLAGEVMIRDLSTEWDARFARPLQTAGPEKEAALLAEYEQWRPERDARLAAAAEMVEAALAREPALYQAFDLLAQIELLRVDLLAEREAGTVERFEAALEQYANAIEPPLEENSLRAAFSDSPRVEVLTEGFDRAIRLVRISGSDSEGRAIGLDYAERFTDACVTSFPNFPPTFRMQGLLARYQDRPIEAITQFERLVRAAEADRSPAMQRLLLEARAQLARLYHSEGQNGEAWRYAETALQQYEVSGTQPPAELLLVSLDLMNKLGRSQEALDLIDRILPRLAENDPLRQELKPLQVAAMLQLNRADEAADVLGTGDGTATGEVLRSVTQAAAGDLAGARQTLYGLLEREPDNARALESLMNYVRTPEARAEARAFLEQNLAQVTDPTSERRYRIRMIQLTEKPREEKNAEILALIEAIPEAETRLRDLFWFNSAQGNLNAAQAALDELEEIDPGVGLWEEQFNLALRLEQFDRAAAYAVKLANENADGAGGARYRGVLALARGNGEEAIRELRSADRQLPANASLKLSLSQAYMAVDPPRLVEAIAAAEEAARINPGDARAARQVFVLKYQDGLNESDPAYGPLLTQAARLNPQDEQLRVLLGQWNERRNPAQAIAQRQAFAERDDLTPLQRFLNYTRLAALYQLPETENLPASREMLAAARALVDELDASDADTVARIRQLYTATARFYAGQGERAAGERVIEEFLAWAEAHEEEAGTPVGVAEVRGNLLRASFYEQVNQQGLIGAAERRENRQRAAAAYEAAREALAQVADPELREQLELEVDIAYAESLFRQREYARAVEEIRAILADLDPNATELQRQVRLRLVDGLLALGDRPAIEAALAEFEEDFPGDERGRLQYAQFLMQGSSEDMARAQQVLTKILSQNPDHALARYMRGSVYFSRGEYEAARDDLRAAKDLDPSGFNYRHRVRLASLYDTLGEDTLAVTELQEILAEDSANPPVVDLLVNMYLKQGRRGEANQLLGNYRAAQPDNPYWPGRMAELSLANEQFAAAARYAEEAYNESGRRAGSYLFNWMRALLLDGRSARVVEIFEGLPAAQQGPLIRLAAARAYRETNAPEAARTQIRAALEQASGISINQVQRVAERSGEVVGAQDLLVVYDEILADPPEAIANNLAAMVRLQVGKAERLLVLQRSQEAYDFVSGALASIPAESRRSEEYVAGLLVKAQSAEAAGLDFDTKVKPVYEAVLEIDPENVIALNNLAFLLAKQGDHVEALPYAQKLRTLEVPQPAIYDTVGVVLMKNGQLAEAQDAFRRALGLNQSFIDANYHLAELFLQYHDRPNMAAGREFANKTIELAKSWLNRNSAAPEERKAQMREWIERAEALLQQRT